MDTDADGVGIMLIPTTMVTVLLTDDASSDHIGDLQDTDMTLPDDCDVC